MTDRNRALIGMFILTAMLSLAVFWSNGGHFGDHEGICVAASMQGGVCPESATFDSLIFHGNALKSYIQNESGNSSLLLASLVLTLVLALVHVASKPTLSQPIEVARYRAQSVSPKPRTQQFNRWLALHESSPSDFTGRA
ncbi:MAG: hypothetical protein HY567_03240 [Candidatus Kerfeldbacteria bacterium]|nr:hypothetical protein [Candidatus Kerfeldbacteria bacterium]